MRMSPKGIVKLMQHEAVMLEAYKDSQAIWTIGVGHTASAGGIIPAPGMTLEIEEVFALLQDDLPRYEMRVDDALEGAEVNEHQRDALISFDFNTGGIYRANLMDDLRAGDYEAAANGFMGWLKPPEIEGRRREEMELFRTGEYGDLSHVPMYPVTSNGNPHWAGRTEIPAPALDRHPPEADHTEHQRLFRGMRGGDLVKRLQRALLSRRFQPGQVDGSFGRVTEKAVNLMLKQNALPEIGETTLLQVHQAKDRW